MMNEYVLVETIGKGMNFDEYERERFTTLEQAQEAARKLQRVNERDGSKNCTVEIRQYVDEEELDYNDFEF